MPHEGLTQVLAAIGEDEFGWKRSRKQMPSYDKFSIPDLPLPDYFRLQLASQKLFNLRHLRI